MFVLARMEDVIQLPPASFRETTREALVRRIHGKYANKVVLNLGLCVCVYDLVEVSHGVIKHGTGAAAVTAEFRLVVFRPFRGEVLHGTVTSCSETAIKVTMGFFDEVVIPRHALFEQSEWRPEEAAYVWHSEIGDLWLEAGVVVRFRVDAEAFHDPSPRTATGKRDDGVAPYRVIGACDQEGLGNPEWWADDDAGEEEQGDTSMAD